MSIKQSNGDDMKRDDDMRPSTRLTGARLKELIQAVIEDSFDDALSDEELLAEPQGEELPPLIGEGKFGVKPNTYPKVIAILNQLDPESRERVFRRFGRYSMEHLLQHINRVKKATDPKSDI